jgi:carbon-monoxide dehydrogenase medium subunit
MMKLRLAQPETLIDINAVTEPPTTVTGHEPRIGAMTRHAQLLDSAETARTAVLHDAEQVIADPVRNWGTVGGHVPGRPGRGPAWRPRRSRRRWSSPTPTAPTVSARDFHTGPYETVVAPGEILTEIRVPIRPGGGSAYEKVGRRAGDWPVGAAGSALWLEGGGLGDGGLDSGTIADAGIGLTWAPDLRAEAEEFLRGAPANEESFARAGELAAASCRPVSDQRGPADYKRHLARELTVRSLRRAWQRAGQQSAG